MSACFFHSANFLSKVGLLAFARAPLPTAAPPAAWAARVTRTLQCGPGHGPDGGEPATLGGGLLSAGGAAPRERGARRHWPRREAVVLGSAVLTPLRPPGASPAGNPTHPPCPPWPGEACPQPTRVGGAAFAAPGRVRGGGGGRAPVRARLPHAASRGFLRGTPRPRPRLPPTLLARPASPRSDREGGRRGCVPWVGGAGARLICPEGAPAFFFRSPPTHAGARARPSLPLSPLTHPPSSPPRHLLPPPHTLLKTNHAFRFLRRRWPGPAG